MARRSHRTGGNTDLRLRRHRVTRTTPKRWNGSTHNDNGTRASRGRQTTSDRHILRRRGHPTPSRNSRRRRTLNFTRPQRAEEDLKKVRQHRGLTHCLDRARGTPRITRCATRPRQIDGVIRGSSAPQTSILRRIDRGIQHLHRTTSVDRATLTRGSNIDQQVLITVRTNRGGIDLAALSHITRTLSITFDSLVRTPSIHSPDHVGRVT